jgi:prepilin-type N-terminal cleavage/methylation domain-containing protein
MGKKGYSLIELIIIISILGILTAMAIPGFRGIKDRAHIFAAKEAINSLRLAESFYKQENPYNKYTNVLFDLFPYGNITQQLKPLTGSISITTSADGKFFTIQASAKDRNSTLVTGNVQRVWACIGNNCFY